MVLTWLAFWKILKIWFVLQTLELDHLLKLLYIAMNILGAQLHCIIDLFHIMLFMVYVLLATLRSLG